MREFYSCASCGGFFSLSMGHRFCSGLYPQSDVDRGLDLMPKRRNRQASQGAKRRQVLQERDGPGCQNCGTTESLTVDHKVPVSRGGKNGLANTWVLCSDCNVDKGDQTVEEWLS